MRTVRLLAVAVVATAVAGCGVEQAGAPVSASPVSFPPGAPTAGESPASTGRGQVPMTSPSAGDERRGDLVRGVRSLRGVIERDGDWVILRTDGGRWALLGDRARALTAGQEARVRGRPAPPPAGCPADRVLAVTG